MAMQLRDCIALPGFVFSLLILFPVAFAAEPGLTPGQPLERELKTSESQSFPVKLPAGHYLRVRVEQHGADVQLAMFGPDGKLMAETSLPYGSVGPEVISIVSRAAGVHRLEVRPAHKAITGRFTLVLEELRPASPRDETRTTTERAFNQGSGICFRGSLDAVEHALARCKQMVTAADGPREQAQAIHRRALVEATLGNRDGAIRSLQQELAIWQSLDDRPRQMATLERIASICTNSDPKQAMVLYQASLKLRREAGDRTGLAIILYQIGLLHSQLGDKQLALANLQESLELHRQQGNRLGEATLLQTLGGLYYQLNDPRQSLAHLEQALALWRAAGNKRGEAVALSHLCRGYNSLEGRQHALDYCQQALPLIRATGDRRAEATALNTLAKIYLEVEDFPNALSHYEQSLALYRTLGERREELMTLAQIAAAHHRQGDSRRMMDAELKILARARETGEIWSEAQALRQIGALHEAHGERAAARDFLERSLALSRAIGHRNNEAGILPLLAQIANDEGDRKTARAYLNQAITYRRSTGEKAVEAKLLHSLAQVERADGQLDAARDRIADSIAIIESVRARIGVEDWRASFFASVKEIYEFQVDLLMQLHRQEPDRAHAAAAFEAAERARARLLLDLLRETQAETNADIREGADPALLARERDLQNQLTTQSNRLIQLLKSKPVAAPIAGTKAEIETLAGQLQQIRARIRQQNPWYAALTQPHPLRLAEIQSKLLDRDSLLLEYSLGKTRSYLFAVTADSIASHELPGRAEIESAARRLYELLSARNQRLKFEAPDEKRARVAAADAEFPAAAAALGQLLLAPVADQLRNHRLLIVADGAMQYLPFAALPHPQSAIPLIVSNEIVSLHSASSLALLRDGHAHRPLAPKTIAVIADPVFDRADERLAAVKRNPFAGLLAGQSATRGGGAAEELLRSAREAGLVDESLTLPRLPFTRKEAQAILALVPATERKEALDFAASHAAVTSDQLKEYRYIHIATHGLINSQHPELSGLILSLVDEHGKPRNGFLRAREIYNLKLPAELVVLSACRTGLGKEINGEGLVGLTQGFLYAGAARVMVSLWDVNDQATSLLMTRLYQAMLGPERLAPAAALRAAQIALWKEKGWQAPYYWAGFVLQGEPR
jgi:CHAT domain-containing protein